MAKRLCFSDYSPRVSKRDYDISNFDAALESLFAISDSALIDALFDDLVESRSTDSDQNDFIQRVFNLGSVLVEASKRSVLKRSAVHNASVWPLPTDLTIKVFSILDTPSVCSAAATCTFFQKCAADPLCFADIDLVTSVPKFKDAVVSKMVHRAGNALQSIKLGYASMLQRNAKQPKQGKRPSILSGFCLSPLIENCGVLGSRLRRLHLYNIKRMDNMDLVASLSVCPSLIDLETVSLSVELGYTVKAVSTHCPLIERFVFDSLMTTGRDFTFRSLVCKEFVLKCPKITTLVLKGCALNDFKARTLVKGFHELKYLDISTSFGITGTFLKNLGTKGGGNSVEVMILRECLHLEQVPVEQFMKAILAGKFRLLRHLDISNKEGLGPLIESAYRCYTRHFSYSFMCVKKKLEQKPNFCLVAEFPEGNILDYSQMTASELNDLPSSFRCSNIGLFTSRSDIDDSSGGEDSQEE